LAKSERNDAYKRAKTRERGFEGRAVSLCALEDSERLDAVEPVLSKLQVGRTMGLNRGGGWLRQ